MPRNQQMNIFRSFCWTVLKGFQNLFCHLKSNTRYIFIPLQPTWYVKPKFCRWFIAVFMGFFSRQILPKHCFETFLLYLIYFYFVFTCHKQLQRQKYHKQINKILFAKFRYFCPPNRDAVIFYIHSLDIIHIYDKKAYSS